MSCVCLCAFLARVDEHACATHQMEGVFMLEAKYEEALFVDVYHIPVCTQASTATCLSLVHNMSVYHDVLSYRLRFLQYNIDSTNFGFSFFERLDDAYMAHRKCAGYGLVSFFLCVFCLSF